MIHERIKALRKPLGLSQTEFGKKLGVTRSVILNIELKKVSPKDIFIEHICIVFHVNKEWLLHGTGEMFTSRALEHKSSNELLNLFHSLQPEFQDYVLKQINSLLSLQSSTGT